MKPTTLKLPTKTGTTPSRSAPSLGSIPAGQYTDSHALATGQRVLRPNPGDNIAPKK